MLTPKASLRAWLSFADDNNPHAAEALEGARKLSHRTADAVAWLTHPSSDADGAFLMRYLLQLDLEATPELCRVGLAWVEHEFANTYRPTPDNPLPYSDLVERLGIGHPLMAVQWFALQGCDAEKEVSEAELLIRAYGEAPQRAQKSSMRWRACIGSREAGAQARATSAETHETRARGNYAGIGPHFQIAATGNLCAKTARVKVTERRGARGSAAMATPPSTLRACAKIERGEASIKLTRRGLRSPTGARRPARRDDRASRSARSPRPSP